MPRIAMPPEADIREGTEDSPRARKGKPMADMEGSCKDCEGNCAKCSAKKRSKKKPKSMFAAGFKEDAAPVGLKCGKSAISKGEKCHKGPATPVNPEARAASAAASRVGRTGGLVQASSYNRKTGALSKNKSSKAQGPSAAIQVGQGLKRVGLGALEAVKWSSGYNIGKAAATNITKGKNEKASQGEKFSAVAQSAVLGLAFGGAITAPLGAARRVGWLGGQTDLQQHANNEKKEKAWRRSVGYRDGSTYAKGFKMDLAQLAI